MAETTKAAKRARANTAGEAYGSLDGDETSVSQRAPAVDVFKLRENVEQLDRNILADIVIQASQNHPDVGGMVDAEIRKIREREQSRVKVFDHYSKMHNMISAFDVANDIVSTVQSIAKQCGPFASTQTRWNGLSVLRKIGKTIALSSNDTLGHEVQKHFQSDSTFVDGMWDIVSAMTPEERQKIRQDESSPEALWPKLLELDELRENCCIFEDFGGVLDLLEGKEGENGDHGDEGEDEESEDEEGDDYDDKE
ncbi:hypothetical protein N7510_007660 [Penicillium lagena]|uniref:uncharacterized protein n=1 Tax=Penicillium lagena TaxID=94218 RepID=UPI00253FF3B6|nr:uncharacterized protein N7510_007660 [Penicillium lagena]KAJ5610941.1 hypothetical protein N7510_007660 [Penicillium lagena]